jgi:excisionase family DNA binding protein
MDPSTGPSASPWLTTAQAAEYLQTSEAFLRRAAHAGRAPAYKIGARQWRWKRADLDVWLEASQQPAGTSHHQRPRVLPSNGAAA